MYQINAPEFAELFNKDFPGSFRADQTQASLPGKFDCKASSYKGEDFDILHFRGTFLEDTCISEAKGMSHVSLHYQLRGVSDAVITGFKHRLPMHQGEFNIINCIDPCSAFKFPKQEQYEYISVCLHPDTYRQWTIDSNSNEPFQLFTRNRTIGPWLQNSLHTLLNAPIPPDLKLMYMRSKITELLILSMEATTPRATISSTDTEKLMAVKDHLEKHFLDELNLKGIARQFQLNEFKLKKGFRELFDQTVFGYIHDLRMNHAHLLIRERRHSVSEVAFLVGYQSDAAFIRAFRLAFGSSPGKLNGV